MQKIERVKLKNGLEVYFLFDKLFTTSSIQMCFKIGWRNDEEKTLGLAHLFEHLVGKRTKEFPGKSEFAKKLDEMGIVTNAQTGPDTTVYFQNQTNENLLSSLKMLYEAIYFSVFELEDLEKEKKVVLTEAREYLDNDDSVLWKQTSVSLFPGTSFEKFFFGSEETMKNISLGEFEEFYKMYKNPKNSILLVSANNSKNKKPVLKFLEKFYKENKNVLEKKEIEKFEDKKTQIVKFTKIEKPDRTQTNLRVGYLIENFSKKERVTFSVINSLLLGGFSGKVIQKLRDELGLIYWMQMGKNQFLQNKSFVMFATGCEKGNREEIVKELQNTISDTIEKVSQADIDKTIPIKVYYQKTPPNAYEDLNELMDSIIYKNEYIQTDESLRILKTIRTVDIKRLMLKIFKEENKTVCVLE